MGTVETGRVEILAVDYQDPVARELVAGAMVDLAQRYGDGDETPVRPGDFRPPAGAFLVAYAGGRPVGCAGWRGRDGGVAELKRMYTAPAARRRGVGRRLLAAVEESARSAGRIRVILETGRAQPEAIALYEAAGYRPIPHFGHYRDEPDVVSLGRDL